MLQTINCQLIFVLIYCAYVASNIFTYIFIFFCMLFVNAILRHEKMAKDGKFPLDSGCRLRQEGDFLGSCFCQTNHKNRIFVVVFIYLFL